MVDWKSKRNRVKYSLANTQDKTRAQKLRPVWYWLEIINWIVNKFNIIVYKICTPTNCHLPLFNEMHVNEYYDKIFVNKYNIVLYIICMYLYEMCLQ